MGAGLRKWVETELASASSSSLGISPFLSAASLKAEDFCLFHSGIGLTKLSLSGQTSTISPFDQSTEILS